MPARPSGKLPLRPGDAPPPNVVSACEPRRSRRHSNSSCGSLDGEPDGMLLLADLADLDADWGVRFPAAIRMVSPRSC